MRQQEQTVAEEECDTTANRLAISERGEGSGLRVRDITVLATRKAVQLTGDTGDAVVVTADGKGTFLIRRRKGQPTSTCPLLNFEVRRLEVVGHRNECDRPEYGQEASHNDHPASCPAAITGPGARCHAFS